MTTEFSAAAQLRVELDERSLNRAEQKLSNRMGSVRPGVTDGGRDRPTGSVRPGQSRGSRLQSSAGLLSAQLEKLDDIHEALENMAISEAKSGGTSNSLLAANLARGGFGSGIGGAVRSGASAAGGFAAGGASTVAGAATTGLTGTALAAGGVVGAGVGGLALLLNEIQPNTKTTGNPAQDAQVRGTDTQLGGIQDALNIDDNGQLKLQMPGSSELPRLKLPTKSELSTLSLGPPSQEEVSDLVLGTPAESALPDLGVVSDLPQLDVTGDLPKVKIDVQSIREALDLGGDRENTAASRDRVEIDYSPTFEFQGIEQLERQFEQDKRELQKRIDDLVSSFSGGR